MTNSLADLLVIDLKILGDPDFIKQDDVFYRPVLPEELPNLATKPSSDTRLLPNDGSLVMDSQGLYVQLLFRTPTDIDETTGLMKYNPNYKHSVFSGLYEVITVTSNFSNGQFVQELLLVRLPRQSAYDYVNNNQNNKSDNRNESSQQTQPGLSPPNPNPVPSDLISGGGTPASPADLADTTTDQTAGSNQPIAEAANNEPPAPQSDLRSPLSRVRDTAPTQAIDANTRPPQLGNDATDAQLAQNYKQKATYMRNLAKKYPDNPEYLENAAQYDQWAARREALANGTSNQ
jgi:hypothetical protein